MAVAFSKQGASSGSPRSRCGNCARASTTYKDFVKDVKPGDRVLLADGSVELRVFDKTDTDAICEVVSGGRISDRKGINLPGVEVSAASLSKKDIADLRFGLEAAIDFVALSFVRKTRRCAAASSVSGRSRFACADHREDREAGRLDESRRDSGRERRRDGGAWRPGRGDGARKGAVYSEVDHRAGAQARQVRDHGDADAGVDDRESVSHPRGSQRHRQRHL